MLSKEELLQPRYKVIADYPYSPFKVGDIIQDEGQHVKVLMVPTQEGPWNGVYHPSEYLPEYPAIFKALEWWEERHLEDFPHFVVITEGDYGLNQGEVGRAEYRNGDRALVTFPWGGTYIHLHRCQPATEQEYNNYISKRGKVNK